MSTGYIHIHEHSVVIFPFNGEIWLTVYQIAELFEVFPGAVTTNIKSIFKKGILDESQVYKTYSSSNKIINLYNMKMIIALSYFLSSNKAEKFREWVHVNLLSPPMATEISFSSVMLN
jgi:hypothetical protein